MLLEILLNQRKGNELHTWLQHFALRGEGDEFIT